MSRPPVTIGAHSVQLLRNGREVYPAMAEAIDAARVRVRIEMYWWQPDAVGRHFLDRLVAAARRGVDVRVLVDGFGSWSLPRDFWRPLQAAGGNVAAFHPLSLTAGLRTLLSRDHRKIVVADERTFIGGLNFASRWAPVAEGGADWRDTAVEVRGKAASAHLVALFEDTWDLVVHHRPSRRAPTIAWHEDAALAIFSNSPMERRGRRIRQAYLWALRRAKKSIDITSAYFSPRPVFLRALAHAARRGVRVRVLVPLHSDVELARQASLPLLRWLRGRDVQIFGYGGAILHAKTAVVDDEWCTVGSHNLDGLSWAWNLECNVVFHDAAIATQLAMLFEEDLSLSVKWPEQGPGCFERFFPSALRRWYSSG